MGEEEHSCVEGEAQADELAAVVPREVLCTGLGARAGPQVRIHGGLMEDTGGVEPKRKSGADGNGSTN